MSLIRRRKETNFIIFSDSMSSLTHTFIVLQSLKGFKVELDIVQKVIKDYTDLTNSGKMIIFCCIPSSLDEFQLLTMTDVAAAVRALPDKQSASDQLPTSMLKTCANILLQFLVELFNRSLLTGSVPAVFMAAYITPRQKKPDLDQADVCSYQPISNLSVLSKLLE